VFKSGDFMKKLTFLASLFLLTSCDALTGEKPKPSVSPTPVAIESPNPTSASGSIGSEPPGPTTSGIPAPSQMPANSASTGTASAPAAGTGIVPGNDLANSPSIPKENIAPVIVQNSPLTQGTDKKSAKNIALPSDTMPRDQNQQIKQSGSNGDQGNRPGAKENSKDVKNREFKNGKGSKPVGEAAMDYSGSSLGSNLVTSKPPASPQTIADGSIGVAKVGATLAELKKSLKNSARFETQTDFAPGLNAIAVKQQGKVQFYIPYAKGKKIADTDQVRWLITENPIYKTAEGISTGMTIKKATAVYGNAQLAFSPQSQVAEEIVRFSNQPGELRFFTSGSESKGRAGIYDKKKIADQGLVTTEKYSASGKIKRIIVTCSEAVCPATQP
jgi:hypothetical protein